LEQGTSDYYAQLQETRENYAQLQATRKRLENDPEVIKAKTDDDLNGVYILGGITTSLLGISSFFFRWEYLDREKRREKRNLRDYA